MSSFNDNGNYSIIYMKNWIWLQLKPKKVVPNILSFLTSIGINLCILRWFSLAKNSSHKCIHWGWLTRAFHSLVFLSDEAFDDSARLGLGSQMRQYPPNSSRSSPHFNSGPNFFFYSRNTSQMLVFGLKITFFANIFSGLKTEKWDLADVFC